MTGWLARRTAMFLICSYLRDKNATPMMREEARHGG